MENKVPWLFPRGAGFLTACYRRKGQADTDPLWSQWVLSTGPCTWVSGAPAIFYLQLCIIFLEGALEAVKASRPTELGSAALGGKRYQYVLPRIVTCSFYVLISLSTISSVQLLSRVRLFVTPWTAACQASLSITISQSSLKLMSIQSVMPSNLLFVCRSLLLLPSTFVSIRVFSNELDLVIRWPKYLCFSIGLSSEYSGLISFRIDWFDL